MSLDAAITAAAVGLAALWLARRLWRALGARRAGKGCAGGCGCSAAKVAPRR